MIAAIPAASIGLLRSQRVAGRPRRDPAAPDDDADDGSDASLPPAPAEQQPDSTPIVDDDIGHSAFDASLLAAALNPHLEPGLTPHAPSVGTVDAAALQARLIDVAV